MSKLLPILLILMGLGGGVGAGLMLRPDPAAELANPCGDPNALAEMQEDEDVEEASTDEFVKLSNQFVVPVVVDDRISALVVLSLSLAVEAGAQELVFRQEPKIRDSFLQVLFDHANAGGFDGAFTSSGNMELLRRALLEAAQGTLGKAVSEVLIVEVVRQDA